MESLIVSTSKKLLTKGKMLVKLQVSVGNVENAKQGALFRACLVRLKAFLRLQLNLIDSLPSIGGVPQGFLQGFCAKYLRS